MSGDQTHTYYLNASFTYENYAYYAIFSCMYLKMYQNLKSSKNKIRISETWTKRIISDEGGKVLDWYWYY